MIADFVAMWTGVGLLAGAMLAMYSGTLISAPHTARKLTIIASPLTAAVFGALAWRFGERFDLLPFSVLAAAGVALSLIDVIEQRLPSMIIYLSTVVVGLMLVTAAILQSRESDLLRALAGMVTLTGMYLAVAMVSRGGLGAGDVKLTMLLGLTLGWRGWSALLAASVFAWFTAALVWLVLWAARSQRYGLKLPMGPFLLFGAMLAIGISEAKYQ